MTHDRLRMKGRRGRSGSRNRFAMIPGEVIYSENWKHASKPSRALVADIAVQYNGHNNGDLTASITVLRPLGWTSPGTIKELLLELRHYGFLTLTRQGGLLVGPSLYALGWQRIDACLTRDGVCKLDDPSMFGATLRKWQTPQPKYQRPQRTAKRKRPRIARVA